MSTRWFHFACGCADADAFTRTVAAISAVVRIAGFPLRGASADFGPFARPVLRADVSHKWSASATISAPSEKRMR